MPQRASQHELDLAQSQSEAFSFGIEVGVTAVEFYQLSERGRVTGQDVANSQMALMRGETDDGRKLASRAFDTKEAIEAFELGKEVGAIDLLHRKAEGVAA